MNTSLRVINKITQSLKNIKFINRLTTYISNIYNNPIKVVFIEGILSKRFMNIHRNDSHDNLND